MQPVKMDDLAARVICMRCLPGFTPSDQPPEQVLQPLTAPALDVKVNLSIKLCYAPTHVQAGTRGKGGTTMSSEMATVQFF